ncbi:DUF3618 domain-containing protein [Nocardioides mangrovicus]|uniref:DUF3618 domain-containing protein n=1 Tax=Nocardioides mangrovicus TaxID=2478913 RepID=A0A3L8P403_9ACTN|nr:DUF3618 domain-containing protein [Nocardioides mangrovicus]RLV49772.1 DUF3618 domain-containing protein [Nocardioides mangrovicus]
MPGTPESRDAIEREMEQTRQHLGATLDQLVYRANPKTIAGRQVAAVKGYFVDVDGAPRTGNIVKVVGGAVGAVVVVVVLRRIVRD